MQTTGGPRMPTTTVTGKNGAGLKQEKKKGKLSPEEESQCVFT